ncbi:MAG TPA: YtxH domain-containing protein [Dehalococcoidia bacterium]|nr:YtxH domain-containing protein [Dehalococcoidia bacterium]
MKLLLVGLIMGALLGLAIGLLTAPSAGNETRSKLRERAGPTVLKIRDRMRREEQAA